MIKQASSNASNQEIFHLEVKGAENYEILKNLRNALYAKDGIEMDDKSFKNKLTCQPTIVYNNKTEQLDSNSNKIQNKPLLLSRSETVEKYILYEKYLKIFKLF